MSDSPIPSRKLPPSQRDFEIYEEVHIQQRSTWQAALRHDISQTRVRQIIRRVVEWLSEVLPPQAKVAREQELYLARQIAADRFQHQLEEVASLWQETREPKYAGIRLRLTTAQARLGVVGGVAAGLAADAIEGLEVPAYQPPPERIQARSASDGHRRGAVVAARNETLLSEDAPELTEGIPNEGSEAAPPSMDLDQAKFIYGLRHILIAPPHRPNQLEEAKQALLAAGYQLDDDEDKQRGASAAEPPIGDFSAASQNADEPSVTTAAAPAATSETTGTYDDGARQCETSQQPGAIASRPLLIAGAAAHATELKLSPHQPGAVISDRDVTLPSSTGTIPNSLLPIPDCTANNG
jgi:hypothetical protein